MNKLFNDKILKAIPIIFLILVSSKLLYTYNDLKTREYNHAKKEAEVLNSYVVANRIYHQKLFLDGTLELSEKTLPVLPAYSSHIISDVFSKNNSLNIRVKTVSDRARNADNTADSEELKVIKFFNENTDDNEYFSSENSAFYQYGSALRIEPTCLTCHGKKESAPEFIQKTYTDAYDYKLGELRGIISIQIPTENFTMYFIENFFKSILYDILFLIFLFLGIYYLLSKSKRINKILEFKVIEKTEELKNSLLYDRLTHLPNRLKLMEDISNNANSKSLHLALINIDSFKDINDLYGYDDGDKIIIQIAKKAQEICKNSGSVYKLPNDEYALFSTLDISQEEFLKVIKNIINKIQESKFEVGENLVFITLSCGIASNEHPLLIKANNALQIAKNNEKSIVFYDNSLDTKEKIALNIDGVLLLKNAIKEDGITPYFQPIYNTHTKKIEKYESLARIIKNNGEVIPPFIFLGIAMKSKLYPEITKAIIRKSFDFFKDKDYEFSINLSISDIRNTDTIKFITDKLEKFKNPNKIVFEILESDKIENYEELKKFIKKVKKYGCKIAIDDFGSGYSNFSHIFELNVDYLKIDSSLVKFITTDENSRVITKTIINFASSLGLKTIAEFVEDKESLDLLEKMGVDFVQGYYIGKPSSELNSDFNS